VAETASGATYNIDVGNARLPDGQLRAELTSLLDVEGLKKYYATTD
jgi:hypothetical protein